MSWSGWREDTDIEAGAVSLETSEPALVIVRHGATEWSQNGRHTGRTDLPLLSTGRERAAALRSRLDPSAFRLVLCSPLRRARETCELAGFGARMEICEQLREWDYGDYEGLTSVEIHAQRPDWSLWRDGCPGGESPDQVAARADAVIARAVAVDGPVPRTGAVGEAGSGGSVVGGVLAAASGSGVASGLGVAGGLGAATAPLSTILFAHGHILRVLTARWIGMQACAGERFALATAGVAKLGHEHTTRVIEGWNITTL